MTNQTIKRVGFPCMWLDSPDQVGGFKPNDDAKRYNTGTTTVAWMNRQSKSAAEERLWDLMKSNIESTRMLVDRVSKLPPHFRMLRLSSDILPLYTEPTWGYFWRQPDVIRYCETHFSRIGDIARERDVRLSFHPGPFCVMASHHVEIVEKSIEEFEYHADMARWMGYGVNFQDMKINVHISGKNGPLGMRESYSRLSSEARNCITIENEENSWGLSDCLTISDIIPIVLDVHHNWCREGEYIDPNDDLVKRVIDSWRGIRPTMHYSVSSEDYLTGHSRHEMPNYKVLLETGFKKQKLRAHSNDYWNSAVNAWAKQFSDSFDIICESKYKNLSSFKLYNEWCPQQ